MQAPRGVTMARLRAMLAMVVDCEELASELAASTMEMQGHELSMGAVTKACEDDMPLGSRCNHLYRDAMTSVGAAHKELCEAYYRARELASHVACLVPTRAADRPEAEPDDAGIVSDPADLTEQYLLMATTDQLRDTVRSLGASPETILQMDRSRLFVWLRAARDRADAEAAAGPKGASVIISDREHDPHYVTRDGKVIFVGVHDEAEDNYLIKIFKPGELASNYHGPSHAPYSCREEAAHWLIDQAAVAHSNVSAIDHWRRMTDDEIADHDARGADMSHAGGDPRYRTPEGAIIQVSRSATMSEPTVWAFMATTREGSYGQYTDERLTAQHPERSMAAAALRCHAAEHHGPTADIDERWQACGEGA